MARKSTNGYEVDFNDPILDALLDDPTKPSKQLADELGVSRQKLWRRKKGMEEQGLIWGYTAVLDESKLGAHVGLILMKLVAITDELADIVIERTKKQVHRGQNVRVSTVWYLNGPYDCLINFSAPDSVTAHRFYEYIRTVYKDFLMEKPIMMEMSFPIFTHGRVNPDVERVRDMVP